MHREKPECMLILILTATFELQKPVGMAMDGREKTSLSAQRFLVLLGTCMCVDDRMDGKMHGLCSPPFVRTSTYLVIFDLTQSSVYAGLVGFVGGTKKAFFCCFVVVVFVVCCCCFFGGGGGGGRGAIRTSLKDSLTPLYTAYTAVDAILRLVGKCCNDGLPNEKAYWCRVATPSLPYTH